jgi:hypothetical protein
MVDVIDLGDHPLKEWAFDEKPTLGSAATPGKVARALQLPFERLQFPMFSPLGLPLVTAAPSRR